MNQIYLLTGGNVGNRLQNLKDATERVERTVGPIVQKSLVYETAPWGLTEQGSFLNQVLQVDVDMTAVELLRQILGIELEMGRKRVEKMGPRVIDIDILFYGAQVISSNDLIVPHPRIAERRFVLTPLNEIAPDFIHPVLASKVSELLRICLDRLEVKIYNGG